MRLPMLALSSSDGLIDRGQVLLPLSRDPRETKTPHSRGFLRCAREDLNLHGPYGPQGPQPLGQVGGDPARRVLSGSRSAIWPVGLRLLGSVEMGSGCGPGSTPGARTWVAGLRPRFRITVGVAASSSSHRPTRDLRPDAVLKLLRRRSGRSTHTASRSSCGPQASGPAVRVRVGHRRLISVRALRRRDPQ